MRNDSNRRTAHPGIRAAYTSSSGISTPDSHIPQTSLDSQDRDIASLQNGNRPHFAVRQQPIIETSENVLRPIQDANFVNYEPVLLVPPNPHSWPEQRHPQNPALSIGPFSDHIKDLAEKERRGEPTLGSRFNGYKYRSADLQSGIDNFRAIPGIDTNPNRPYEPDPAFQEKAQISHYNVSSTNLEAGEVAVGEHGHVDLNELIEIDMRSGRTIGHNHPPGPHTAWEPSLGDQALARQIRHLRCFVKVPDVAGKHEMDILQFNGAFPPRHYISLPNPQNYPIPPDSPDIAPSPGGTLQYPPFKSPPVTYQGPPVAYPGPHGYDSRSPSPDKEQRD